MTKYCGNCGFRMNDSAKVCGQCGTPFGTLLNKKKPVKALIIIGVISILFTCGAGFVLFGGRSYQKVVDEYIEASLKPDAEIIVNLTPKIFLSYNVIINYMDVDSLIDMLNEGLDEDIEKINSILGLDWDVDYEMIGIVEKSEDQLKYIKNEYAESKVKVSDAFEAKVKLTITSSEEKYEDIIYVPLIKSGRNWYYDLLNTNI